ncbi:MAG: transposase [Calditrichaceae bacterium]|nr:transposase [Calditrichaceae bacterium]
MKLNDTGRMIYVAWEWLAKQYHYVELDAWTVMPNHLHGIIIIRDRRGGSRTAPTMKRKPIGRLIGAFKTVSTKHLNQLHNTPGAKLWQRNYHEHIIRNEHELNRIRKYIRDNPLKWQDDRHYSN